VGQEDFPNESGLCVLSAGRASQVARSKDATGSLPASPQAVSEGANSAKALFDVIS